MIKIRVKNSKQPALVDDCDSYVAGWSWCLHRGYAVAMIRSNGGLTLLHRFVLNNPPYNIDHRNRNKLDCRRNNLRQATQKQNSQNQGKTKGTRLKGIYYNGNGNGPYARIFIDGKHKQLGRFISEKKAALAYDEAALFHFKEFACLNFPRKVGLLIS